MVNSLSSGYPDSISSGDLGIRIVTLAATSTQPATIDLISDIREAYEQQLQRHGHVRDPAQVRIVDLLAELQQRLEASGPKRRGMLGVLGLGRREREMIPGLYIWGGVGRGKTFLMDLFFETLRNTSKRRVHFHRMMHNVHDRLKSLDYIEDPLDAVASDLASEARVLCFDEFFVSDIGDAMILGRLLEGLFARGVTLVTTSNAHPDELYREGLQRQRFLPAIAMLHEHTQVVEINGDTDYRLELIKQAGTYLAPDDDSAMARLAAFFEESASTHVDEDHVIDVNGREIHVMRCAKGIAWFDFADICEGPRSQADYIEIARWYPTVIVSGVPELGPMREDAARRFIAMVDEFYDRRVKLIVAADRAPHDLYKGRRLTFEFERTVSRLTEMQSGEYLHLPHLP
jgi:cell division protein ZapE